MTTTIKSIIHKKGRANILRQIFNGHFLKTKKELLVNALINSYNICSTKYFSHFCKILHRDDTQLDFVL